MQRLCFRESITLSHRKAQMQQVIYAKNTKSNSVQFERSVVFSTSHTYATMLIMVTFVHTKIVRMYTKWAGFVRCGLQGTFSALVCAVRARLPGMAVRKKLVLFPIWTGRANIRLSLFMSHNLPISRSCLEPRTSSKSTHWHEVRRSQTVRVTPPLDTSGDRTIST